MCMTHKEELHEQIETLNIKSWNIRAVIHALIDLEHVSAIECSSDNCLFETRSFVPRKDGPGHQGQSMTIDHRQARSRGGNDRLENLRLMHQTCNLSCAPRDQTKAQLANRKESHQRFLATGNKDKWLDSLRNRPDGWNKKSREDDKRRGGNRQKLLSADRLAELRAERAAGASLEDLMDKYGISRGTAHSAATGRGAYA